MKAPKLGDMHGFIVSEARAGRKPGGYLLLEIVAAIGIAAMVLSGIFMLANGSLSLANTIVTEGRSDARKEAFLNFLERNFETLPGNAEIELVTRDTGQRYMPTITIQNAPTSFSFGGQAVTAKSIVLKTVPSASGGVNVVLEYYADPLLDDEDDTSAVRPEPVGSIVVYRDLWRFEVLALDSRNMEWVSTWDVRGRLPLQLQLNAIFEPDGEEILHYLWIPPKVSPSSFIRDRQQGQQPRTGGGGQGGGEGQSDGEANPLPVEGQQ